MKRCVSIISPNCVSLKFKPPDTHFISSDCREKLRNSCNSAIICLEQCSKVKVNKDYQKKNKLTLQGQSTQTGFFELALRDRKMQVRFFLGRCFQNPEI